MTDTAARAARPEEPTEIPGGVTAAAGYRAAGVACGIKREGLDLALVVSDRRASAAGVFTTNRVEAAPVTLSRTHLERSGGTGRAVVINSGCANACTGQDGMATAEGMAERTAAALECPIAEVLVASTGVIGVPLDLTRVASGIDRAATALGDGHAEAAAAIMTTDVSAKERAVQVRLPGGIVRVGGMAKGAGMIEPMMATMLAVVTTDAEVDPALLQSALRSATDRTFNAITVDGECSTNDSVFALANGASGVRVDASTSAPLVDALTAVCRALAIDIVRGAEGATKLVTVTVTGAATEADARRAARALANSLLVKTAIHGGDPNWGRLLAVAGRAGVDFAAERAEVRVGSTLLFGDGRPHNDGEPEAAEHLSAPQVSVEVNLGTGGTSHATMWTCDLSAEYVRINADYRT